MANQPSIADILVQMMEESKRREAQFLEESKRRDDESKRREETFLQMLQSLKTQTISQNTGADLVKKVPMFSFDPESGGTFSKWICRFEDAISSNGEGLPDEEVTKILISKLDTCSYSKFTDHILPRTPRDLRYDEAKTVLDRLFGEKVTIFRRRYEVFRSSIGEEDYSSFSAKVNRMCEQAQLDKMTMEDFKCLIFVSGLKGPAHADICTRLLRRLEVQDGGTLSDLTREFDIITKLQVDSNIVSRPTPIVSAVEVKQRKKNNRNLPSKETGEASTRGACFICGSQQHFRKDCPKRANHSGHQRKLKTRVKKVEGDVTANRRFTMVDFGGTEVKMQLDSGADVTVISKDVWEQIGSPSLERSRTTLGAANGTPIEVIGQFDVEFTCKGHSGHGRCYVADKVEQLLGIEWMNQLPPLQEAFNAICCRIEQKPSEGKQLLSDGKMCSPDVFKEELGRCKKKAQLVVKQGTRPTFCRQRKIPCGGGVGATRPSRSPKES